MTSVWDLRKYSVLPAVITAQGTVYCYRDLDRMQAEFAELIQSGSMVCIVADNDMASLIAYLSCLQNRITAVIVPGERGHALNTSILQRYQPDYIWLSAEQYQKELSGVYGNKEIYSFYGYVLLEQKTKKDRKRHPDLALLLPTSGSTGAAKLVRLSYQNIVANTVAICRYMKLTSNDRAITSLPMSYTYGLSVINTFLYSGGSIVLSKESVVQSAFWRCMQEYGVTFLPGVPYTYECMKKFHVRIEELKELRIMAQAGGKLSEELQRYWGECAQRTGKQFFIMYGQTEATARIAYLPCEDCLRKPGSVGIAIPDSEIFIADRYGHGEAERGQRGEIICRGQHVSMGYAEGKEDLMLGDVNHGCLHTGDIGHMDEEGYLYIDGRMNRFAKIYGKRIDLDHVERMARDIWDQEVVVLSDDKKIYLYTDADMTEEKMTVFRKKTGLGKEVVEVRKSEEVPRQYNGKIKYRFRET